jgi:Uma2 family endonuclease
MLEENLLMLSLPTEEDLPDSDEKPVDNELHTLIQVLLRAILAHIWAERFDWFFGVNLGVYPNPSEPAIRPDGFLSLGVERVRADNKLRLSYLVYREKVMPQWVLEVVSRTPGGEYDEKFSRYAELGILYYVIYNPSHFRRDGHEPFEVYRLEARQYIRQVGNPVWMPEIGLGIGHELGIQEGIGRDWLYWYDKQGVRYLPLENALAQERILREREQLMRRAVEEQLEAEMRSRSQTQEQLEAEMRSRIQIEQELEQERIQLGAETRSRILAEEALVQEKQTIALNMLGKKLSVATIAEVTGLTTEEVQALKD